MRTLLRQAALLSPLFLLLSSPIAAAERPPQADEVAGAALELPPAGALQITTEEGVCYLDLSAGADGPIRMPLEGEGLPAILVSTRRTEKGVVVTLAHERAELETEPIGKYELPLGDREGPGESAQATLPRLKTGRASTWALRLVSPVEKAMPGCCSCGAVKIQCCPYAGKCLSCSTCGQCCG